MKSMSWGTGAKTLLRAKVRTFVLLIWDFRCFHIVTVLVVCLFKLTCVSELCVAKCTCTPRMYSLCVSDYTWTVIQSLAELRKIKSFLELRSNGDAWRVWIIIVKQNIKLILCCSRASLWCYSVTEMLLKVSQFHIKCKIEVSAICVYQVLVHVRS